MTTTAEPVTSYLPLIASALAHDPVPNYTLDDVLAAIDAGRMKPWFGYRSIVLTELGDYPLGKVLHVFLAAGDGKELEQMEPHIMAWAKAQGCTRATMAGRKGWLRSWLTRHLPWTDSGMVLMYREI